MVLYIAVWMGVRGVTLSGSVGTCVLGVGWVEGCWEMWRWTSSFITRPSLPLPRISVMLSLCSCIRCRTAGVARFWCLLPCGGEVG